MPVLQGPRSLRAHVVAHSRGAGARRRLRQRGQPRPGRRLLVRAPEGPGHDLLAVEHAFAEAPPHRDDRRGLGRAGDRGRDLRRGQFAGPGGRGADRAGLRPPLRRPDDHRGPGDHRRGTGRADAQRHSGRPGARRGRRPDRGHRDVAARCAARGGRDRRRARGGRLHARGVGGGRAHDPGEGGRLRRWHSRGPHGGRALRGGQALRRPCAGGPRGRCVHGDAGAVPVRRGDRRARRGAGVDGGVRLPLRPFGPQGDRGAQ